jgi:hypothetical protein
MSRSLRDERGAIMAISAILIPVLLVLTALIYDGGTWFTHKRQLQNRADAGALAAGVEYQARWTACGGDAATKLAAANAIDAAARQYAGDPQSGGTLHNTELTDQNRINVEINSNAPGGHVDPDTSWNDPAGSGLGPCDAQTTTDRFSPQAGAHYVDVGVRERDQRSLFGMFGIDLFRNEAHARVELKTAAAGRGFLPIALPDQDIRQVEIRYFWSCSPNGPETQIGQPIPLQPLSSDYQTTSGVAYWGPTSNNQPNAAPTGVSLNIPDEKACGGNYISIREEVRLAGVDSSVVNIDAFTCNQLSTMQYTDCWDDMSEIRVDKDNPKSEPWFHHVVLTGGAASAGQCNPDVYFAKLPAGDTSCKYSGSLDVDWNDLNKSPPPSRVCTVSVGDTTKPFNGCANGSVAFSGTNSTLGRSTLSLTWNCTQTDPGPPVKTVPCPGTSANTSIGIRSLFLGDRSNSTLVTMVRTSGAVQPNPPPPSQPGAPIDWVDAPQATTGGSGAPITVYPTVGLEGSLYVGQRRVLRAPHCKNNTNSSNCDLDASSPNTSQSVDCEPTTGGQGHDFVMFANGCRPWYGPNTFTDSTWWKPPCPVKDSTTGFAGVPPNDPAHPWRCLVKAPGFSPNTIADGIAAAIGNCSNVQNNSCNKYTCTNPNYYDPSNPDQWALQGGEPSPRVVFIFIVPYAAYKNTGSQDTMPLLTWAAFYVTGFTGSGGAGADPCIPDPDGPGGPAIADETTNGGDIVGYFVDYTAPDAPGDPHSICTVGQLQPCTPVLVR